MGDNQAYCLPRTAISCKQHQLQQIGIFYWKKKQQKAIPPCSVAHILVVLLCSFVQKLPSFCAEESIVWNTMRWVESRHQHVCFLTLWALWDKPLFTLISFSDMFLSVHTGIRIKFITTGKREITDSRHSNCFFFQASMPKSINTHQLPGSLEQVHSEQT